MAPAPHRLTGDTDRARASIGELPVAKSRWSEANDCDGRRQAALITRGGMLREPRTTSVAAIPLKSGADAPAFVQGAVCSARQAAKRSTSVGGLGLPAPRST